MRVLGMRLSKREQAAASANYSARWLAGWKEKWSAYMERWKAHTRKPLEATSHDDWMREELRLERLKLELIESIVFQLEPHGLTTSRPALREAAEIVGRAVNEKVEFHRQLKAERAAQHPSEI